MCQTAMNFDSIVLIFSGFPVLNWPVLLYVIILKSPKLRKQEIVTQLFWLHVGLRALFFETFCYQT